jgi:hypothetical protein
LAAQTIKAVAGSDPFADLLFSPRAAFIWDHSARAIAWLNAAARSKFGAGREELQQKLGVRLARSFSAAASHGNIAGAIEFKAGFDPKISCSFEVLELAGGHEGMIVSEMASAQERPAAGRKPAPPKSKCAPAALRKRGSASAKLLAAASAKSAAPARSELPALRPPAPAARQLTPDEMRAFKAVGRTVRRLARDKRQESSGAPAALASRAGKPRSTSQVRTAEAMLFSAFDLVLLLDADFVIAQTEGRPQAAGWRKSALLGRAAEKLLTPAEQAILRRMIKKLQAGAKICRDTLVLTGEARESAPFRAILGRCSEGALPYFLALLSLELPARLQRQPAAHAARLAA